METLWVDFQNSGKEGVRLICNGTIEELKNKNIILKEGLEFFIWDDDEDVYGNPGILIVKSTIKYSTIEQCWVAQYNSAELKHKSGKYK